MKKLLNKKTGFILGGVAVLALAYVGVKHYFTADEAEEQSVEENDTDDTSEDPKAE